MNNGTRYKGRKLPSEARQSVTGLLENLLHHVWEDGRAGTTKSADTMRATDALMAFLENQRPAPVSDHLATLCDMDSEYGDDPNKFTAERAALSAARSALRFVNRRKLLSTHLVQRMDRYCRPGAIIDIDAETVRVLTGLLCEAKGLLTGDATHG